MTVSKSVVHDAVVGRDEELNRIAAIVTAPRDEPAALVIQGEPGIGKTTLWRRGVHLLESSGRLVLRTTPAASESSLPLSVLTDLLEPYVSLVRTDLPPPQRRALDVALALAEPSDASSYDERVLRAATLSALRALSRLQPVGLAVDDCQWMDAASAAALSYALRRLQEPVFCLFVLRDEEASPLDFAHLGHVSVERLSVGPLSIGATQKLLLNELGVTYSRPVIRRLVETSEGNPFYALELSRGLERAGDAGADRLPLLTQPLDALIAARLGGVSERARRFLGLLSLLPFATTELLHALGVADGLDEAVAARLAVIEGDAIRFAHPLLSAGVHARLGPEERRGLHSALASVVDDPVERARQLARATLVPSAETASEVIAAASIAASRGRSAVAAELGEEATRLTPESDLLRRRDRRLLAARFHAQAGSFESAGQLLDDVIPELPPGDERADALRLRATLESDLAIQQGLLRRALAEAGDPSTRAEANALLARNHLYFGDLPSALGAARESDELAWRTGDPMQIAAATTIRGLMETWARGAPSPDVFWRARALAAGDGVLPTDTYSNPHTLLAVRGLYRYELDESRDAYTIAVSAAEAAGDVDSLETYSWGLAQLELRAGRYAAAAEHVERLRESQETYGRQPNSFRWIEGLLGAYEGRELDARSALEATIERAEAGGNWFFVVYGRAALAFLELSLGDAKATLATLEPVLSLPFVTDGDPGQTGILPVATEAMLATGALDRASRLVSHLERRGRELDHAWCLASAGRCRGLLLGEERDFGAAFDAFDRAIAFHDRVPAEFERARTLLALGSIQRRARRRRDARASLGAAVSIFEELGARLWAHKARAELGRIGGRSASPGDLTPNEAQIAALVAQGKTNKEVAAVLFVSDRTVEWALTQIYRKLGIRSRTELARKLASNG